MTRNLIKQQKIFIYSYAKVICICHSSEPRGACFYLKVSILDHNPDIMLNQSATKVLSLMTLSPLKLFSLS